MSEKPGYVRLGVFVLVSVALLGLVLFVLVGRAMLRPTLVVETYFDQSVAGLEVGAAVNFRGVPVGQVSEILLSAFDYEPGVPLDRRRAYIVVRAKLSGPDALVEQWRSEVQDYVKKGLRAQTQLAGITGQLYLVLDYFDPKKYPALPFEWTPRYSYIPSAPSLAGEVIAEVQDVMASLAAARIPELAANLRQLAATLEHKIDQVPVERLAHELTGLITDSRGLVQRLDQTLAATPIEVAMSDFARASRRVEALAADPRIDTVLTDAQAFTGELRTIAERDSLGRVLGTLDKTLQRVDALVGDNQYDIRVIVEDLRAAVDNLRALSERLSRDPAGTVLGGPPERIHLPRSQPR